MLDEQHGDVARQPGDGGEQFLAFLARHARRRLVEQQHFRPGRQRQRDFQKPLLAVGQFARARDDRPVQRQGVEDVVGLVDLVAVGGKLPPPGLRHAAPLAHRQRHRFQRGEMRKQRIDLKGAHQTAPHPLVRRQAR